MEACSFGKPIILLENELWKYIYPNNFVTTDIWLQINKIINNYEKYSLGSINFIKNYKKELIVNEIYKIIKTQLK
jgi:hypothetical protein